MKVKLNKGKLPTVKALLISEIENYIDDINLVKKNVKINCSSIQFIQKSVLKALPLQKSNSIDAVLTSPPYCNRYDYTRIYALELVFLGTIASEINALRQNLLSSTVESKSKREFLKTYYASIHRESDYNQIINILDNSPYILEITKALQERVKNGGINNKGILKMVKGYFEELAFIYYELYRVCKQHAQVAFVNDNVRYAAR